MENILTFVLGNSDDKVFKQDFYELDNFIFQANAILILRTSHFIQIADHFSDDYSFRLIIHPGLKNRESESKGYSRTLSIQNEIEKYFPNFKSVCKSFLTSKQEVFPNGEKLIKKDGSIFFNFNNINEDGMVNELPIYNRRMLKGNSSNIEAPVNRDNTNSEVRSLDKHLEFVVLTALDEDENEAFRNNMDGANSSPLIMSGRFKKCNSTNNDYNDDFILAKQDKMGMVDAAFTAAKVIYEYGPKYLIMAGCCGGRKEDDKVKLFDIVIPRKVFDFSFGVLKNGKFIRRDLDANFDSDLINFLKKSETKKEIKVRMIQYSNPELKHWDKFVANVNIHFDVMASGPWVVKTEGFLNRLGEVNDYVKALEMESYSIGRAFEIFKNRELKTLVVKSVMDFTENDKKDIKDNIPVKQIAGYISYLCTRAIMSLLK